MRSRTLLHPAVAASDELEGPRRASKASVGRQSSRSLVPSHLILLPTRPSPATYKHSRGCLFLAHNTQMGLRMDDLHAPTVASGPTSQGIADGVQPERSLQELIAQKERLEAELSALGSVLDSVSEDEGSYVSATEHGLASCRYEHIPHHSRWLSSLRHRRCSNSYHESANNTLEKRP